MDNKQLKKFARNMAKIILNTMAWNEPLNGDDIHVLVTEFEKELNELMGN